MATQPADPAGARPRVPAAPHAVLLAEHEPEVAELARRYLTRAGLQVRLAADPDQTTAALGERSAAVAVLDLTMPGLDARRLRRLLAEPRHRDACGPRNPPGRMPAVFLVGNGMRPRDLRVSADSCLARPFSPRLLVAKVQAAVSRPADTPRTRRAAARATGVAGAGGAGPSPRTVGALTLDPAGCRVRSGGRDIALTPTEFTLLTVLAEHAGRVMTRDRLLAALGDRRPGNRSAGDLGAGGRNASGRAVDVYVAQLRAKLGDAGAIRTVRGVGYALDGPAYDGPALDRPGSMGPGSMGPGSTGPGSTGPGSTSPAPDRPAFDGPTGNMRSTPRLTHAERARWPAAGDEVGRGPFTVIRRPPAATPNRGVRVRPRSPPR